MNFEINAKRRLFTEDKMELVISPKKSLSANFFKQTKKFLDSDFAPKFEDKNLANCSFRVSLVKIGPNNFL